MARRQTYYFQRASVPRSLAFGHGYVQPHMRCTLATTFEEWFAAILSSSFFLAGVPGLVQRKQRTWICYRIFLLVIRRVAPHVPAHPRISTKPGCSSKTPVLVAGLICSGRLMSGLSHRGVGKRSRTKMFNLMLAHRGPSYRRSRAFRAGGSQETGSRLF